MSLEAPTIHAPANNRLSKLSQMRRHKLFTNASILRRLLQFYAPASVQQLEVLKHQKALLLSSMRLWPPISGLSELLEMLQPIPDHYNSYFRHLEG